MAFRFGDSFSHYVSAELGLKWTTVVEAGGSFCAISTTGGPTGAGALEVVTGSFTSTYVQKTLDNQATLILGARVKANVGVNFGLMFVQDGSTRQIGLAINTNGTLYIEKNGTVLATSTNVLTGAIWNYIELAVTVNTSSGSVAVNVNGFSWISYSGNTSHSGNNYANSECLGDWLGPSSSQTTYYADHYCLDGTGSINNAMWGDISVTASFPGAAGNYTSFLYTGAASAYQAVDETSPDGDTSYVYSSSVTSRESFTFAGPGGSLQSALAIQTVLDSRKDSSGTRTILASLRISSTDYDGSAVSLSTSYAYYVEPRDENPHTSSAWTTSDFTSIEMGIEIAS